MWKFAAIAWFIALTSAQSSDMLQLVNVSKINCCENSKNPFFDANIFLDPGYTAKVTAAAAQICDSATATKALSVAKMPTFIWIDTLAAVPSLGKYLEAASTSDELLQIVVYDLPDRDCAALASSGEFSIANNGVTNYKNYIDQIVAILKQYPTVSVVAIIEPDSLANLVTNLNISKCANAEAAYKECITYANTQLSAIGVTLYMDAGHAGWLGWPNNLAPAAQLFTQMYQAAGSPSCLRGLATNVANYNAFSATTPDNFTSGNPNYDEIHYINALASQLSSIGWNAHFIVDQGRSGQQGLRQTWADWCNVKGAGFGTRPTTCTNSSLIDAIVWVKPGGESDGTSNTSSPRFDPHCGYADALQSAPEAGSWFQEYFVDLVTNANPTL